MEVYRNLERSLIDMSMLVARMEKMKSDNLVGCGNHNLRLTKGHSNPDIDVELSYLNYDLVGVTQSYKVDIEAYINENKSSSRAIRKDAVLVNEWIITSDKSFFDKLSSEETKRYFETAVDYFAEKFGRDNIRYAQVHLDERTPHMHMGVVPFTQDWKLSAKTVFGKETLKEIQDELPRYLQERGFDIERGRENSKAKHLDTAEFKEFQRDLEKMNTELKDKKEALEDLNISIQDKKRNLDTLNQKMKVVERITVGISELENLEENSKKTMFGKDLIITKEQFEKIKEGFREVTGNYHHEYSKNNRLRNEVSNLNQQIENHRRAGAGLREQVEELEEINRDLKAVNRDLNIENIAYFDALGKELTQEEINTRYICYCVETNQVDFEDEELIEKWIDELKDNFSKIKDIDLIARAEIVLEALKNALEAVWEKVMEFGRHI